MRLCTRPTNAFSTKVENRASAIVLYFMYYNFGRIHQTLRVTPAMEASVTDHVWSVDESSDCWDRGAQSMATARAFRKYVAIPFAFASAAAAAMATIVVFERMTGFQGTHQPSGTPVPFVEAWTDVSDLAGLIFVVTFLVLIIWTKLRSRALPTRGDSSN